jgi:Putative amidase domain
VGDIVQVDFGKGEGLSHTMVVTKKRDSDGMIYLAAHTISHLEMPVYNLKANYPDVKIYTWKLRDTYYY